MIPTIFTLSGQKWVGENGEKAVKGIMTLLNPLMIGSAKKYAGIHAQTIARGMVFYLDNSRQGVSVFESHQIGAGV